YISTTQQNRTSPYMPGGEPRPSNPENGEVSDRAAAARKARLEQFDREVAEARERREREKGEKEVKTDGQEIDDGGKEKGGFRQGLKEKIAGWRE
ncbi:hypothetical protein SLS54_005229, partial [Diplodia seriata]